MEFFSRFLYRLSRLHGANLSRLDCEESLPQQEFRRAVLPIRGVRRAAAFFPRLMHGATRLESAGAEVASDRQSDGGLAAFPRASANVVVADRRAGVRENKQSSFEHYNP
jgi:hypothetical protein